MFLVLRACEAINKQHVKPHVVVFFFSSFLKIREQNLQDKKTAGPQSQVLCASSVVERSYNQVSLWSKNERVVLPYLFWPGDELVTSAVDLALFFNLAFEI